MTPRYDQITLNKADRKNTIQQIVSPNPNDEDVWIHQNAWFHLADFDEKLTKEYALKNTSNGVYLFVLSGEVFVDGQLLETRDGMGIWNTTSIELEAKSNSEFLLMEVPIK